MSPELYHFLVRTALSVFALCCTVACALQVIAWSRHGREGVPVSFRALREPEVYFDATGVRQIRTSRLLLNAGIAAYLLFGALNLMASVG